MLSTHSVPFLKLTWHPPEPLAGEINSKLVRFCRTRRKEKISFSPETVPKPFYSLFVVSPIINKWV